MFFFLNSNLSRNVSGIEHAELKRLRLFRNKGQMAAIVNIEYNRFVHDYLYDNFGVYDKEYINFYDYFGRSQSIKPNTIVLKDVCDLKVVTLEQVADNEFNVYNDNHRKLMNIITFNNNNLDTVSFFDGDGILIKKEMYDTRGFKSLIQNFATIEIDNFNTWLSSENFIAPSGDVYLTKTYRYRHNQSILTNFLLVGKNNKMHSFMNTNQIYAYLLDCLNVGSGVKSVFISDRSNVTNLPMIMMKTDSFKIEHFHNIHFKNYWDPMNSELTYPSISKTDQLAKIDLIITPTLQQANDMFQRIKTRVPIIDVPVGVIPDKQLSIKHIKPNQRVKGKIVTVARLFWEKHLDDTIKAIKIVHDKYPWVTLDIYGYPDATHNEEKKLYALVKRLEMEGVVSFKGYVNNLNQVYDTAQLTVMSSRHEGFVLAILEAAAHGVPCVSYNTNYGPAYLVKNGKNGFIVPNNDVNQLANKIMLVLSDNELLTKLSVESYKRAQDFSENNVWKKWQDAFRLGKFYN